MKEKIMNLIISLETTCDLSEELLKKYDFKVVDMEFLINGEVYNTAHDTVESTGLYTKMREGVKTSTSQVNEAIYEEHFSKLLESGKDVLHLAFSSGLSNTYLSAKSAAEKLNEKSKNKVYVVDSLCACSGHGLFAIYVKRFADQADDIEKVVTYAENIKWGLNQIFTVDSLKYLANGGRVKTSTAIVGNLLNIKPILRVDNDGHLENTSKVFSRKKSLVTLCEKVVSNYDPQYDMCFVSHADSESDAKFVADYISSNTSLSVTIENLGPVIGCHSGPGTIAIFYMSNKR